MNGPDTSRLVEWITTPDGVELAADVWRPRGEGPSPVLLMQIPYRANDFLAASFEYHNRYFVDAGYATVVVDLRGLGASGGIQAEAFSPQEVADAITAVEWAASQSWSSGAVGMWGVSYGAITSLRAGAARPEALRAIVAIQGTTDLYGTIYPGGALNFQGAVGAWGSLMLALQLLPPSAQDGAGTWGSRWAERLEEITPYVMPWGGHPTRDEFWTSKDARAADIEVPTFLIGGWRDIFADDVVRTYEGLGSVGKLWVGPWMHGSPDFAPSDAIDHLPAMRAWWDRWLRDEPNGIDRDPPVTLFVQNGSWRHETTWPIDRTEMMPFALAADGGLVPGAPPGDEQWIAYRGDPSVGLASGLWEPLALGGGGPREQSPDDRRSLCWTSQPFEEGIEITGRFRAQLRLRPPDGGDAVVVLRLNEVTASGESLHVTSGHRRLSLRHSLSRPDAVPTGEPIDVIVDSAATSYRLAPGSRLRVAISTALFPQLRLDGVPAPIDVGVGGRDGSTISVPRVGPAPPPDATTVRFPPTPLTSAEDRRPLVLAAVPRLTTSEDLVSGTVGAASGMALTFETADRRGVLEVDHLATCSITPSASQPSSLSGRTRVSMRREGVETVVVAALSVEGDEMRLDGSVVVDGETRYERSWSAAAPGLTERREAR